LRRIRLTAAAEADILMLLAWTDERFGDVARRRYEALLATALRDLSADPARPGVVLRHNLGDGVCLYHLRHSRNRVSPEIGLVRRPRHLLLFRQVAPDTLGIGRVLHDAMDADRHGTGVDDT